MHLRGRAFVIWIIIALAATVIATSAAVLSQCPPRAAVYRVDMTPDDRFAPREISVPAGSVITWVNIDRNKPHTVTADIAGGPNSDAQFPNGIASGQSFRWMVPSGAASGTTYYYHCRFHGQPGDGRSLGSGMSGLITVR